MRSLFILTLALTIAGSSTLTLFATPSQQAPSQLQPSPKPQAQTPPPPPTQPPATTPPSEEDEEEEYGEVDEDIIIQDEENTNDDEGVNN